MTSRSEVYYEHELKVLSITGKFGLFLVPGTNRQVSLPITEENAKNWKIGMMVDVKVPGSLADRLNLFPHMPGTVRPMHQIKPQNG